MKYGRSLFLVHSLIISELTSGCFPKICSLNPSTPTIRHKRVGGSSLSEFNAGISMVGKQSRNVKWEVNFVANKQNYSSSRCFTERFGSKIRYQKIYIGGQQTIQELKLHINLLDVNRGSIDYSRVKVTYKSVRDETYKSGSINLSENVLSESSSSSIRQHLCFVKSKENGWDLQQGHDSVGHRYVSDITITAEYLPRNHNVRADWASRSFQDSSKWCLSPKDF